MDMRSADRIWTLVDPVFIQSSPSVPAPPSRWVDHLKICTDWLCTRYMLFYERYVLTALGSGRLFPFYCSFRKRSFMKRVFRYLQSCFASIFNVVILQWWMATFGVCRKLPYFCEFQRDNCHRVTVGFLKMWWVPSKSLLTVVDFCKSFER